MVPCKQGHVNGGLVTGWSDRCEGIIGHWRGSLKAEASQNMWDTVEKKVKKTSSKAPCAPACLAALASVLPLTYIGTLRSLTI